MSILRKIEKSNLTSRKFNLDKDLSKKIDDTKRKAESLNLEFPIDKIVEKAIEKAVKQASKEFESFEKDSQQESDVIPKESA